MQNELQKTKEFFNSVADKWDAMCFHDDKKLDAIFSEIGLFKDAKVMDVGCGTGILISRIFDEIGDGGKLVAVDYSEKMLKIAKSRHDFSCLKFMCNDISCVKFKENYFDFIICYSVFPHFKDKLAVLTHLSKALAPGGKLCICHSESRDAINAQHASVDTRVAQDVLASSDVIHELFEEIGLTTVTRIDNDCLYIVIGKK